MERRSLVWLAFVAAATAVAPAEAIVIVDFDDVADGTAIDAYYASLGLPFGFVNPIGGSIYARGSALADTPENVVSVFATGIPAFDARDGAVEVVFSTPQSYVAIDAAILRLPEGLGTPVNEPRLEIYDVSGAFVTGVDWDFAQIPQPGVGAVTPYQTLSYASPTPNAIGKVRILSTQPLGGPSNFGLFDDLAVRSHCSHDLCQEGPPLVATCDACVRAVCAADSYCCQGGWDGLCVGAVANVCRSEPGDDVDRQCQADAIAIDAFDSGHLVGTPAQPIAWGGYTFVGTIFASFDDRTAFQPVARQYHKFDLSGVTRSIVGAQLLLEYPEDATNDQGGADVLSLQEVVSDPDGFGFDFAAGAPHPYSGDVFVDLADGPSFGTRSYGVADEGSITVIPLNAAGVAAINAARGGVFAVGGSVVGAGSGFLQLFENTGDYDFAGQDPRRGLPTVRRLVLIPSPCGDGSLDPGESCDDGNTVSGDGCTATCEVEECRDGLDDDGDGAIDFPADPGCASANDLDEHGLKACDNGVDDDGDGPVDYRADGGGDPGCSGPSDNSEGPTKVSCGFGAELAFVLALFAWLDGRRRRVGGGGQRAAG
jgi:cysteine-rich repeat protein